MHQDSVLSQLLFTVVVDVVTEMARGSVLSEIFHTDDFVLISETIVGHKNKLKK